MMCLEKVAERIRWLRSWGLGELACISDDADCGHHEGGDEHDIHYAAVTQATKHVPDDRPGEYDGEDHRWCEIPR